MSKSVAQAEPDISMEILTLFRQWEKGEATDCGPNHNISIAHYKTTKKMAL